MRAPPLFAVLLAASAPLSAQPPVTKETAPALRWRTIGPDGNRLSAAVGEWGNPEVAYFGAASGGIWKTEDGGTTWAPVFDDQDAASISALAVSPSDPAQVWAGTGGDLHHPARAGDGERHLPLDGRGTVLRASRAHRDRADRADPRPPGEPRAGVRLRPRTLLRAAAGAGGVSDPGRRRIVGPRAPGGREHRLFRPGDGPPPSPPAARRDVAAPDQHLGTPQRRAGERRLSERRWRGHLGTALRPRCGGA